MFRGGDRIAARGVHDHNTFFGGGFHVDIVHTDARPSHHLQVGRGFNHSVLRAKRSVCKLNIVLF